VVAVIDAAEAHKHKRSREHQSAYFQQLSAAFITHLGCCHSFMLTTSGTSVARISKSTCFFNRLGKWPVGCARDSFFHHSGCRHQRPRRVFSMYFGR
jgi:hypothetical protein